MNDAVRHYDELLAEHYSWMVGVPFEQKAAEQKALLTELGFTQGQYGTAIDLGAGPGYQSAALADLGFSPVIAIDTSKKLLDELSAQKGPRAIECLHGDVRHVSRYAAGESAEAIVCMGDVLTHLERHEDVSALLGDCYAALKPKGRLVLTFRDLSQELAGLDRFIPVQSDADRVMVCVLEYEPETVLVHDLIRHPLHLALAYAGAPLYRSRITRHDAPASVWQAYTVPEVTNCFREAGAAEVSATEQFLYRMGVVAQKPK